MKFTLRRSGRRMATIHTPMTLGGAEIMKILCTYSFGGWSLNPPGVGADPDACVSASRPKLVAAMREILTAQGTGAFQAVDSWARDVPDDQVYTIARWALLTVLRHFPEAVDTDLVNYARPFGLGLELNRFGPPAVTDRRPIVRATDPWND